MKLYSSISLQSGTHLIFSAVCCSCAKWWMPSSQNRNPLIKYTIDSFKLYRHLISWVASKNQLFLCEILLNLFRCNLWLVAVCCSCAKWWMPSSQNRNQVNAIICNVERWWICNVEYHNDDDDDDYDNDTLSICNMNGWSCGMTWWLM